MKSIILLLGSLFTYPGSAAEPPKRAAFEIRAVLDKASPDSEELTLARRRSDSQKGNEETLQVEKKPLLDTAGVKSAAVGKSVWSGQFEIQVVFTEQGAKLFAKATRDYTGQRIAIIVDGQVYCAPRVMEEIRGGAAVISGSFSEQEAKQLAARLNELAS